MWQTVSPFTPLLICLKKFRIALFMWWRREYYLCLYSECAFLAACPYFLFMKNKMWLKNSCHWLALVTIKQALCSEREDGGWGDDTLYVLNKNHDIIIISSMIVIAIDYSYLTFKTHFLFITNNYFCVFSIGCCRRLPQSNHQGYGHRVEGWIPFI